jgi:hypothetical protein
MPKQKHLKDSLNYIRAYVTDDEITNALKITPSTLHNIATGKSRGTYQNQMKIIQYEQQVTHAIEQQRKAYINQAQQLPRNSYRRRNLIDSANRLEREHFNYNEVSKRQKVMREHALPTSTTERFLEQYTHEKSEKNLKDEMKRFDYKYVESYHDSFVFTDKKLTRNKRVNVRGIVYANVFISGMVQLVRDFNVSFPANLTLSQAEKLGRDYFNLMYGGDKHLEVNPSQFENEYVKYKPAKGKKGRGERYQDLSKYLVERYFVGIIV